MRRRCGEQEPIDAVAPGRRADGRRSDDRALPDRADMGSLDLEARPFLAGPTPGFGQID